MVGVYLALQRLVEEGAVTPWLQQVVAPTLEGAVLLVDTAGATEEARVSGSSLANHREARLVVEVARTLLKVRQRHLCNTLSKFLWAVFVFCCFSHSFSSLQYTQHNKNVTPPINNLT